MTISVKKYHLPDFKIFDSEKKKDFFIWIPDDTYIILGRSNHPEKSLYIEKVKNDNIKVLKRPSGGETVIISPNTIVISVKLPLEEGLKAHDSFNIINRQITKSLEILNIKDVHKKGISDIAIAQKKILGSAIYKKPNKIFYHAVLNYNEDVQLFDDYLKHPTREPDYRLGRKHSDFVTSIKLAGNNIRIEEIVESLKTQFENFILN